jgi:hypothetical protein
VRRNDLFADCELRMQSRRAGLAGKGRMLAVRIGRRRVPRSISCILAIRVASGGENGEREKKNTHE